MAARARRGRLWVAALLAPLLLALPGCEQFLPPEPAPKLRVDGREISTAEVALELRSLLWRRSQVWRDLDEAAKNTLRRDAVEACVENSLVAAFAARPPHAVSVTAAQGEAAFQQFIRQFEPPDGWRKRLELQRLTEAQLRERLTAELAQLLAIEHWLKAAREKAAAELDEPAARRWFDANREKMRLPERVRVSHIFLTAHDREKPDRTAEMAEIHRQLSAGEATFGELAARHSDDERSKKAAGELGWMSRDRVPGDLADALFALPVGQPSAPFRTALGWHIALVHEKRPSRLPEFAETREEILAMLENEWRVKAVDTLRKELRHAATIQEDAGFATTLEPAPWE